MTRTEIMQEIKRRVLEVVPEAEVWLYGSQARGDYSDDSDWDVLIITSERLSFDQRDKIFDAITKLSLQTGELITINFNTFDEVCRFRNDLFYENVLQEKITL